MRERVDLETSIPSYLTARPSRDLISAAHRELTREWWEHHRHKYDLFVSGLVLEEISLGDPDAARRRIDVLAGIQVLEESIDAKSLAKTFVAETLMPKNAGDDAMHVAIATLQRMDFLLTWNCRHIANAAILKRLEIRCAKLGYTLPRLCTPEQLMG